MEYLLFAVCLILIFDVIVDPAKSIYGMVRVSASAPLSYSK